MSTVDTDSVMKQISRSYVCEYQTKLELLLDPFFGNDLLRHSYILHKGVYNKQVNFNDFLAFKN